MPRNLYASVAMFRRTFTEAAAYDANDAAEIERRIETASRRVDDACRRFFFAQTRTRVFDGGGRAYIRIPDLLTANTVKLDEDGDRTFELTLSAATDYYLEREFYEDLDADPKTVIRLDGLNGQRSLFPCQERVLQIAGVWGYTQETEAVAGTGTLADASTTALTTSQPDVLEVGQTLKIEAEQVYVRAGSGTNWTVERAVNGTSGAGHAAQTMQRYVYVPEVREATLILAGRMWKRRDTSYANVIANPVVGTFETFRQTDPDVAELLWPLRTMEF